MEAFLIAVAAVVGGLGFFACLALIIWVAQKGEVEKKKLDQERDTQRRQLEHAERLKALEQGQPLPDTDLAWAAADRTRAIAAGIVGLGVPVGLGGIAIAATALVLTLAATNTHVVLLCTVWGVCSFVSANAVWMSLGVMHQRSKSPRSEGRPISGANASREEFPPTAVSEQPFHR
jgi:hypothetical protein